MPHIEIIQPKEYWIISPSNLIDKDDLRIGKGHHDLYVLIRS